MKRKMMNNGNSFMDLALALSMVGDAEWLNGEKAEPVSSPKEDEAPCGPHAGPDAGTAV